MKMQKYDKLLGLSVVIALIICAISISVANIDEYNGKKGTYDKPESSQSYDFNWLETLPEIESEDLRSFKSYEEFKEFVNNSYNNRTYYYGDEEKSTNMMADDSSGGTDYSTTNVQVKGVDEADIVKTDGEYIYTISDGKIIIVKAYPTSELSVVSEIKPDNYFFELFINKNKLIVFESENNYRYLYDEVFYPFSYSPSVNIKIYDISDKSKPRLSQNVSVSGGYFDSRMIGDFIYVITHQNIYYYDDNITMPIIENDNVRTKINATEIKYFNNSETSYSFLYTNIISVNLDSEDINFNAFLLSSQNMYVSPGNIYLTYNKYFNGNQTTVINRFTIIDGIIKYTGVGNVNGNILNQFSMDEYNQHFRIATTAGNVWGTGESTSLNHLYILDEHLDIVGKVENLAKGERIYSARFMGKRAYIVTFKKVDPLFVIDVENPKNPKVLGYLKITGYSDYLHPYDENHIIGIGKETKGGNEQFSWYQGVKVSLFDVSNVSNPIETAKIEIGDRGTGSDALYDHKAVLFSKNRNLLVLPIRLAEINESKYDGEVPDNAYGEFVWSGAFVLNIDKNEISERGRITHDENNTEQDRYGYYGGSYNIKRSLYIENNLYTISNSMIKVNKLDNLEEVGKVEI